MQNTMTDMQPDNTILSNIEPEMDVYDSEGNKFGSVDQVHFGEGHDAAGTNEAARDDGDPVREFIASLFRTREDLPQELRGKLMRHGFATVNTSPLTRTYFFIPEDVDHIEDGAVYLNRTKDGVMYK